MPNLRCVENRLVKYKPRKIVHFVRKIKEASDFDVFYGDNTAFLTVSAQTSKTELRLILVTLLFERKTLYVKELEFVCIKIMLS